MSERDEHRSTECGAFVPLSEHRHVPLYYLPRHSHPRIAADADVWDFAEVFDLSARLGSVVKYAVRAGRKPGCSRVADLTKAMECLRGELEAAERERERAEWAAQPHLSKFRVPVREKTRCE